MQKRQPKQQACHKPGGSVGTPMHRVVVVGGGIAGVSCAQECARIDPDSEVLLLSASESLKDVRDLFPRIIILCLQ